MTERYALIASGRVTNIILASAEFADQAGAIPAGMAAIGDLWDGARFSAPAPRLVDPQQLQADIVAATQARLDAFAQTRNYDSILSACTYASSAIPKFSAEGQAAVNGRDATWAALYTVLADVQTGKSPMPGSFADIEPLLPVLAWESLT